jgi:DnaJ family protein A protein 5
VSHQTILSRRWLKGSWRIKKAYRKKALELHPDRNFGNVEETTKLFADIQGAYEVLSDPQERAWYDSHRDAVLGSGNEGGSSFYEHNIRITTAEDIMKLITRFHSRAQISNSPDTYFTVIREQFETLSREEHSACEWEGLPVVEYPSFGSSKDGYEEVVKPFYAAWTNFSTKKTFSWKDVHRYSEAPDRRIRRMMEKENKRLRDDGIREFNEAVRSLVAFVRKRDPRYVPNTQSEAERQRALREATAAQAARSRAANQANLQEHVLPGWAQSHQTEPDDMGTFSDEEEKVTDQYECMVCNKTFKSEKQYETHEKSKKHLKAVHQLRKEMRKENKHLKLDEYTSSGLSSPNIPNDDKQDPKDMSSSREHSPYSPSRENSRGLEVATEAPYSELSEAERYESNPAALDKCASSASSSEYDPANDDYASRQDVEKRILGSEGIDDSLDNTKSNVNSTERAASAVVDALKDASLDEQDIQPKKKIGKAKEKRAKRAARQNEAAELDSKVTNVDHDCCPFRIQQLTIGDA